MVRKKLWKWFRKGTAAVLAAALVFSAGNRMETAGVEAFAMEVETEISAAVETEAFAAEKINGAEAATDAETERAAAIETETPADTGNADISTETAAGTEMEAGAEIFTEAESDVEESPGAGFETETAAYGETEPALATEQWLEETEIFAEILSETETESETGRACTCGTKETDAWVHDWDCPVFAAVFQMVCTCGTDTGYPFLHDRLCEAQLIAMGVVCTCDMQEEYNGKMPYDYHEEDCEVVNRIRELLCDCGSGENDPELHQETCAYRAFLLGERDDSDVLEILTSVASGTLVRTLSSFKVGKTSPEASSSYNPICFRSGTSSFQMLGTAVSGQMMYVKQSEKYRFWQPLVAAGSLENGVSSYGVRYNKVIYDHETGEWYDLKCTLAAYDTSTKDSSGNTVSCMPTIGFNSTNFCVWMSWAGHYVLKCQILKTGTDTVAKVKTRLQFTDLDALQVFGIKITDGSIDSRYCTSNSTISKSSTTKLAGISGFETYVGQTGELGSDDLRGNMTLDINAGTFYLDIGRAGKYAKSTITKVYDDIVADGVKSVSMGALAIGSAVDTPAVEMPSPTKKVSNNGSSWANANTLSSVTGVCWYQLKFFVPMQTEANYYTSLKLTDALPAGMDFVQGSRTITRAEDGADVLSWFNVEGTDERKKDELTVSAKPAVLAKEDFYGSTYLIKFQVRMDPTEMSGTEKGDTVSYQVSNKADLVFRRSGQSADTTLASNTVSTTASAVKPYQNLTVAKINSVTGESVADAQLTVYEWDGSGYNQKAGVMEYRSDKNYHLDKLYWTEKNQGKYKVVETVTPKGFVGAWSKELTVPSTAAGEETVLTAANDMPTGTIVITKKDKKTGKLLAGGVYEIAAAENIVSPGGKVLTAAGTKVDTVATQADGSGKSAKLYPGRYRVTETAAPTGYAADAAPQEVSVAYVDKDTAAKEYPLTFENDRLYADLVLTKEVDAQDIVWAHGNPVFTFRITGKDVLNVSHTYYDTVEFTAANTTAQEGKAALSVTARVLAGTYTVTEETTMRYKLKEIHSVQAGSVSGTSAVLDVSKGQTGTATFYNIKVTDTDTGHTVFARNHIGA